MRASHSTCSVAGTCGSSSRQHLAQVADQRDVHVDVLVDLGRVDLDVDLLRVRRVGLQVARDAVVEPHAEGQQQVRFLDRRVDPGLAVHAHHAEVQSDGWPRRRPRPSSVIAIGVCVRSAKATTCSVAPRLDDAAAGQDHRALRVLDERERLLVVGRRRAVVRAVAAQLRLGGIPVELGASSAARPS